MIMLIDELSKNMHSRKQTNLILLDFSKAFNKVAHEKLLQKLHLYGIKEDTLKWTKISLDNRKQSVVTNGFNPSKCQVLHVTRLKTPLPSKYFLHNTELESVSAAKYLGVTISDDLNWGTHIDNITKKPTKH